MWESTLEVLNTGQTQKHTLLYHNRPMRYDEVIEQWQQEMAFREFFISLLASTPFSAYFWETPPVTQTTLSQNFEFVLIDSPQLSRIHPDPNAFQSYFDTADKEEVVSFPSLRKDAFLIVPCPKASLSVYPHLAAFTRNAPNSQQHALWQHVGKSLKERISTAPIWLSTAGLGVSWLHIRLDSRPKYYSFHPYRNAP